MPVGLFSTTTMAYICWLLSHECRVQQHKNLNKSGTWWDACVLFAGMLT